MRVAVFQMEPKVGDFELNYEKIVSVFKEAASKGARLVLFPELALSGYTLDEEILVNTWEFLDSRLDDLISLTREYDSALVFGSPRVVGRKLRNSVVVVKKKREVLFYDKTHLFRAEKETFEPGDDFLVFKFAEVIFGVAVCYEVAFPEISRILALRGAQVILAPFAFGRERERIYETATVSRAIENGAFLLASSTTGKGLMDFIGRSRIVHPSGRIIAFVEDGEELLIADLDLNEIKKYRYEEIGDSHAYFKNRRPWMYKEICGKYRREREES